MRAYATNKKISVHAIAGTYVVLFGLNASKVARRGLLGFTIEKMNTRGTFKPLRGGARAFANYDAEMFHDSARAPIQSMMWGDYTVGPGRTYKFRVIPVYGAPGNLKPGAAVELQVKTEDPDDGKHAVFFNRGVAGSQAYSRRFGKFMKYYPTEVGFGDNRKVIGKPYIKPEDVPERRAYKWLSRGLEEGMLAFIAQAKGKGWGLRAGVYEFTWKPALQAFVDALDRGADVKIVHHAKNESAYLLKYDRKAAVTTTSTWVDGSKPDAVFKNRYGLKLRHPDSQASAAMRAVGDLGVSGPFRYEALENMLIHRTNTQISHNKFIILLKDGVPQQVWSGSTNFTGGGIFGQSNVGHVVRDPVLARSYMDYWTALSADPKSVAFKEFNTGRYANLAGAAPPGITPIFSPRADVTMLDWYAERMATANSSVFFTTAFTVADQVMDVLTKSAKVPAGRPFARYLLLEGRGGLLRDKIPIIKKCAQNVIAWGDVLKTRSGVDEEGMHIETMTGLNDHVNFVHTKYMLVDPLGEDPLVVSGSANFSEASTVSNDENMLVVRGNERVADIFLGEFMRLFNHFQSRNVRNELSDEKYEAQTMLSPDDSWTKPYYTKGSLEWNERLLFAGPGKML
jgi:phosphatidylserine/phosphatidylglycerophosphate/cardiolipin synthase-like enzyme